MDLKADDAAELHYWRKHPNLHGWMERRYRDKDEKDEMFNCVNLLLARADIDALEADILAANLPTTGGFFFGASDGSEREDDLCFVARAREALAAGLTVFYSSW